MLRATCPAMMEDRYLAPDIATASALVRSGRLAQVLRGLDGLPVLWTPV
jgi:histidine ammonia-lyase